MKNQAKNAVPALYGGQAVVEGVMFKSATALSLAVRLQNGKIHTEASPYVSLTRRLSLHRIPVVRGIAVFIEMLFIGISYLNKSTNLAIGDEEVGNTLAKGKKATADSGKKNVNGSGDSATSSILMGLLFVGSFIVSTIVALAAFKFLPLGLASLIWDKSTITPVVFTLTEGLIKLCVFVLYLLLIRRLDDVFRVFQYHGAEHKVIRAYEAGKKLTIANVAKASRYHPRCGTSFVVFVIIISILLYSLIPLAFPLWKLFAVRIALLPLLAGISYEVLTLTTRVSENGPFKFILAPGYFVQSLTTAEPDSKQIEVAIAAFNACKNKSQ